jgi:hypothetical protein
MRKSLWIIPGLFIITAIGAPAAHAGTITFNISGGDTGSIQITQAAGLISAITGTFDGSAISALIAPGGFGGNDNVYTGTLPYFDGSGVSFTLATTDTYGFKFVNLSNAANLPTYAFGSCQGNILTTCNGVTGFSPATADTISVVAPEPTNLLLLGSGLLGLMGMGLREKRLA